MNILHPREWWKTLGRKRKGKSSENNYFEWKKIKIALLLYCWGIATSNGNHKPTTTMAKKKWEKQKCMDASEILSDNINSGTKNIEDNKIKWGTHRIQTDGWCEWLHGWMRKNKTTHHSSKVAQDYVRNSGDVGQCGRCVAIFWHLRRKGHTATHAELLLFYLLYKRINFEWWNSPAKAQKHNPKWPSAPCYCYIHLHTIFNIVMQTYQMCCFIFAWKRIGNYVSLDAWVRQWLSVFIVMQTEANAGQQIQSINQSFSSQLFHFHTRVALSLIFIDRKTHSDRKCN